MYDFLREANFPENATTTSQKVWIAVEIEKSDLEKLNLPEEFVRFVKLSDRKQ